MLQKLSLIIVLILILLALSPQAEAIIRGSNTTAHPGMVSLSTRSEAQYSSYEAHECGGALIAPRWVLTAAHCLFKDADPRFPSGKTLDAVIGRTSLLTQTGERIAIIDQRSPKEYKRLKSEYDIGLLYLARPSKSKPLQLAESLPTTPTTYRTVGWGKGLVNTPWILQEAYIRTATPSRCFLFTGMYYPKETICADNTEKKQSICTGDSGSPLLLGGKIVAVSSMIKNGYACYSDTFPSIFTRVDFHMKWIKEQMSKPPAHQSKNPAVERPLGTGYISTDTYFASYDYNQEPIRVRPSPGASFVHGGMAQVTIMRTRGYLQSGHLRIKSGKICTASPEGTPLTHTYRCYSSGERVPMILINGGKDALLWFTESSCSAQVRFEARVSTESKAYIEPYYNTMCV